MSGDSHAGRERVNVFRVDGEYLFKHYFEGEEVFARLERYYNNQAYRFEVPPGKFEGLRAFLGNHGYELVVIEETAAFVVAVRQYTAHPEGIFGDSVIHRAVDGFNCFLMTDREAVASAVSEGATPLPDTDLENPF